MLATAWKKSKCPPYAGGLIDQPARMLEAVRFVWDEQELIERERAAKSPMAQLLSLLG